MSNENKWHFSRVHANAVAEAENGLGAFPWSLHFFVRFHFLPPLEIYESGVREVAELRI